MDTTEHNLDIIRAGKHVFDVEIEALRRTRDALDGVFEQIVESLIGCRGKVVLTGIGKPGHIATKIAATLASLGTAAFFMHPAEAMHGDLGMLSRDDVVVLMSYSGETIEVTSLLPVLNEIGCTTIAITGNARSTLARGCRQRFVFPDFEEACFLHLAPTSSTTALLVLGDALAVVASKLRNYTREDFGMHHPAGTLGKKLLVKVHDLMHRGDDNAVVRDDTTLQEAIIEMSAKGLSLVNIVDNNGRLQGVITDGDLRRMLQRSVDVYHETAGRMMTRAPRWIDEREMAVDALQRMNDLRITSMPVLDHDRRLVGAILMQDILKAGIVK